MGHGGARSFDALLVAPGGRPVAGVEGARTWWPGGDPEVYGGLLRDIEEGYAKRIAIAVPPGAVWPLPAYELALMTAGEARAMGHDDVEVTIVTPERAAAVAVRRGGEPAVAEELSGPASSSGRASSRARERRPGARARRRAPRRRSACSRCRGWSARRSRACRRRRGLHRRRRRRAGRGRRAHWAAGDGVVSPIKFGGVATHQARRAAAAIARLAGVEDAPDPGEPVIHGRLLVGRRTRRLAGRGDAEGAPLWWPRARSRASTCRAG